LSELARRYAAGEISWLEIRAGEDIAFGDLLVELEKQDLQLPRVSPEKRPEQRDLLNSLLQRAARR
jgi:hypothetical protein